MESLREQKKRLCQNTAEETVTYKKKNLFRPFKIILIVSIILYLFGLLYGNIFAEKIGDFAVSRFSNGSSSFMEGIIEAEGLEEEE